jgi:tRNA A-37 threonylcarbamoyl transferase component Bud32
MPVVGSGRLLAARYELVSVLGSGGMAIVYLARDRVLEREVAVKVLREQFATDPVFLARFTREALNAARLSHPGLVPIFDAGVDQGTAYIVMEVVRGRTVHQVLVDDGPLPVARAVGIAADVCAVLEVAHRAGIVHRDIKPGNIALSDDGRTRVFDFGIAHTSGSAGLTAIATVIGTAAYLSPEQAAGQPADPRSDLYSVGCVLEEMLTGSPPFAAETPVALLHQHIHEEPRPPSTRRPEVSAALDAVVLHLLAKDPAHRPESAAEARRELLAAVAPSRGATLVLPTVTAAAVPARRKSTAAVVAVGAILVMVATLLAFYLGRDVGAPATATGSPTGSRSSAVAIASATARSTPTRPPIAVPVVTTTAAALDVVRQVVAAGQSEGLIDPGAATRLATATDDVAASIEKKKGKSALPRIHGLADLVEGLATDGGVSSAAATALRTAVDQLLRVVDPRG